MITNYRYQNTEEQNGTILTSTQTSSYSVLDIRHASMSEWVGDCCLTSTQQLFIYIMARIS